MRKNDRVSLKIEALTGSGSGIGRADGLAVFVAGAAVGDELIAHIIKVKKNYAIGIIHEIKTPSPDRKPVDCPVFGRCGGCSYRHIHYTAECATKQQSVQDAMQRIGKVTLNADEIIPATRTKGYRNKAQYPVENGPNGICFGFYAGHTHRVVPQSSCLLQPPIFETALLAVKAWADRFDLTAYNEQAGTGLLRHVLLRLAEATGQVMVVPVICAEKLPYAEALIAELKNALGKSLQTVCYNINTEKTNVVLGEHCKTVYGSGFITDEICGVQVRISPHSFYQVNREMATVLYHKAASYITAQDKTVLDLFCGTGTVGLSVLKCTGDLNKKLIGVEIVPQAVEDAKENAQKAGINARFICNDAARAAQALLKEGLTADVIIVDPPRKGCDTELLQTIATGFAPKKLIYISCDPATLARDVAVLTDLNYTLNAYTPVDLFPGTAHVETVVKLVRKKPDAYIDITVDMDELDLTASEAKATYQQIKDYIFEKHNVKVSSLYIAQVKQKYGIIERENYNKPADENAKQPKCPPEKEVLIEEALRHFKMIS